MDYVPNFPNYWYAVYRQEGSVILVVGLQCFYVTAPVLERPYVQYCLSHSQTAFRSINLDPNETSGSHVTSTPALLMEPVFNCNLRPSSCAHFHIIGEDFILTWSGSVLG